MKNSKEQRSSKTGRLLVGGIAFLVAIAFLQVGLRHSAAGGGQKIGGRSIAIDVNPGGSKTIDLASRDYLPVAVFGAKDFDVRSINQSSLRFAGASITKKGHRARAGGNEKRTRPATPKYDAEIRDVNKDGINDLVVRFPIAFMRDISAGTPRAMLKGQLNDGSTIEAYETVLAIGQSAIRTGGVNVSAGVGYCNSTPIVFPPDDKVNEGMGNATPYPSQITVSGAPTSITGVSVTLNDVSHTFPDDLDFILVSPDNRVLVLDNGAWDGTDAVNVDVTFSSAATNYAPADAPMVSGTFKPVSYFPELGFALPAPALTPAAPYAYTFNAFNGINANGTWSLYARDDFVGDTGLIGGGWCISFPTETPGCNNQLFSGSLSAGDATQIDRLSRDGLTGLCGGSPKVCPGTAESSSSRIYDTYTVTNNNTISACMTASVTQSCTGNVGFAIYNISYDPTNFCMNYLNDNGASLPETFPISETSTMSVTLAPGQSVVLVVFEISPGGGCASYGVLVEGNICAPSGGGCTITCPANITKSNDPNQCGAVVTYPAPTTTGTCGTVTCSPASGSFFPKGTTTVTCSATGGSSAPQPSGDAVPSCSFTVTINDTQPPSITCPANVTSVSPVPGTGGVVTYPPPTASDNCSGVATSCTPPSGSTFPLGTTSVTCTATDTSGNTATCSFTVSVFDGRLQDDFEACNDTVLFNTVTGDYRWCCHGTIFTGRAKVTRAGNTYTLTHTPADRRVQINLNAGGSPPNGSASLQVPAGKTICTIFDRDIRNDTCVCGGAAPPTTTLR